MTSDSEGLKDLLEVVMPGALPYRENPQTMMVEEAGKCFEFDPENDLPYRLADTEMGFWELVGGVPGGREVHYQWVGHKLPMGDEDPLLPTVNQPPFSPQLKRKLEKYWRENEESKR